LDGKRQTSNRSTEGVEMYFVRVGAEITFGYTRIKELRYWVTDGVSDYGEKLRD